MKFGKIAAFFTAVSLCLGCSACGKESEKKSLLPELDSLSVSATAKFENGEVRLMLEGILSAENYKTLETYDVEFGLLAAPEIYALGELRHTSDFTGMKAADNLEITKNGETYSFEAGFDDFSVSESTDNILVRAYALVSDRKTEETVLTAYSSTGYTNFAYLAFMALRDGLTGKDRECAETLVGELMFYEVCCDDGVSAEYKYAYAGQSVRLKIEAVRGKSLKEIKFIADTGKVEYDEQKKTFVMPAARTVIKAEYISGLKNPMTIAGQREENAMGYWLGPSSVHWAVPDRNTVNRTAKTVEVTDKDYEALKNAGYRGYMNKRYASEIDATDGGQWRTVAFWFEEGAEHSFWGKAIEDGDIYVSIWLKTSIGFKSSRRFMSYRPEDKAWSRWAPDENDFMQQYQWFETPDTWQELRMDVSCFGKLKMGDGYRFGVLFWNLEDSNDGEQHITVWGAEIMGEAIVQNVGSFDAALNTSAIPYSDTYEWKIYKEDKELVRGRDYGTNGTNVFGLDKGEYTIVYDLSVGAYEEGTVLHRSVTLK